MPREGCLRPCSCVPVRAVRVVPVGVLILRLIGLGVLLVGFQIVASCLGGRDDLLLGEVCHSDDDCRGSLVCSYGRCRAICSYDRDCPDSEVCVVSEIELLEMVCTIEGEGAGGDRDCPKPLERPEPHEPCRFPCDDDTDCGINQKCEDYFCYDNSEKEIDADIDDGGAEVDGDLDDGGAEVDVDLDDGGAEVDVDLDDGGAEVDVDLDDEDAPDSDLDGEDASLFGDFNSDGCVDIDDLDILETYREQLASICPECDLNNDGIISVVDERMLVLLCTNARCDPC